MSATRWAPSPRTPICQGSFSNEPENRRSAEGAIPGFSRKFPRNTRFRDGMIDRWDAGLFDGIPRSVKILGRAVFEILVCACQRLPRCEARQPGLRLFTLTRYV